MSNSALQILQYEVRPRDVRLGFEHFEAIGRFADRVVQQVLEPYRLLCRIAFAIAGRRGETTSLAADVLSRSTPEPDEIVLALVRLPLFSRLGRQRSPSERADLYDRFKALSDRIEPEAEVKLSGTRTADADEPGANPGMRVGRVIVEDDMDDLAGWNVGFDRIEKAHELLIAVTLHVAADDLLSRTLRGGEQGGGATCRL